jgi:1,2-diacylglycerol 3-beta-glucosyltransferase
VRTFFGWVDGLYGEIPIWLRWVFYLEALLIWSGTAWLVVLFVRALRTRARLKATGLSHEVPDDLLWVFLVPALDEEVTIRDSVDRLTALRLARRAVVVVDDGSTDGTGAVLAGIEHPDLRVLRREPPDARLGKAAALNAAWRYLHEELLTRGPHAGWDPARVVVVVVDADGRLHPEAVPAVAAHLRDGRVGGVQTLVRIYNRRSLLGICQDLEFGIYGRLYQAARSPWGTAGMGGNGQFNRLAALDSLADERGPWRDRLTEDQDVGLRLIGAGWINRQEPRVGVDQQGVNNLRRLLRQRTRWAQGNLQAMKLYGEVGRAPVNAPAKVDLIFLLLLPVLQLIVSANALMSLAVFLVFGVPFWGGALWLLFVFYGFAFGSSVLGLLCQAPRITPVVIVRSLVLSAPYTLYAWVIVPALVRAVYRQATARGGWTKTAREPLERPAE